MSSLRLCPKALKVFVSSVFTLLRVLLWSIFVSLDLIATPSGNSEGERI